MRYENGRYSNVFNLLLLKTRNAIRGNWMKCALVGIQECSYWSHRFFYRRYRSFVFPCINSVSPPAPKSESPKKTLLFSEKIQSCAQLSRINYSCIIIGIPVPRTRGWKLSTRWRIKNRTNELVRWTIRRYDVIFSDNKPNWIYDLQPNYLLYIIVAGKNTRNKTF